MEGVYILHQNSTNKMRDKPAHSRVNRGQPTLVKAISGQTSALNLEDFWEKSFMLDHQRKREEVS